MITFEIGKVSKQMTSGSLQTQILNGGLELWIFKRRKNFQSTNYNKFAVVVKIDLFLHFFDHLLIISWSSFDHLLNKILGWAWDTRWDQLNPSRLIKVQVCICSNFIQHFICNDNKILQRVEATYDAPAWHA